MSTLPQNFLPTPLPPGTGIPRPRLDAVLDEAFQSPLVVVHAGAGFGKTTAVAQYLAQASLRAVWFSAAAPDNIPARFWEHLTQVFAQHRPALGQKMQALGFPDSLLLFSHFLAELTGELYEDNRAVAFVFDDLHLITEAAVQGFFVDLLAARLENSSVVFLTRTWPAWQHPLPVVPKLVGPEELRFSPTETKALFAGAGVAADDDAVAEIHRYVSGWPIALALVLLGLRRSGKAALDDALLPASKPELYALFEREIFSQYTPSEQALLVQLAGLDSFPRGLVQAVTGERERDLPQLLAGNIFIQYDADSLRLSFHPLYHEFLREKLLAVPQAERQATYQTAARWCRENGYHYDAINYFSRSGQHAEAWDTLLLIAPTRHSKSEAEFFIGQIEQLPPPFKQERPMTHIVLAALLINNLRLAEAGAALDTAREQLDTAPQTPTTAALLGEYHIVRGLLLLGMEQNGFEQHFKTAAGLLPNGSSRWGAGLRLVELGPGLNLQSAKAGELKKSLACFTTGVPPMVQVLHGAGRGLDKLCECEALFLTGEAKNAIAPAHRALYEAQAAAQYDIVGNALFMLMRIYTVLGNYPQIQDTMEHVRRYEQDRESQNLGIWDIARGWFYAEVGEVEKVALWIRNPVQKGFAPISIDRALLVRLRCLVAAGQYTEALALLEQFEVMAKGKNAVITLLYIELGRAVTHHYLGHTGQAMAALKTAYNLARGNQLFMPFIEYGNRTRTLLEHALNGDGHGIPHSWLQEMHAKAGTYAKRHAYLTSRYRQELEGNATDFSLSARETELLTNLSQGLTREEIADSMQLSVNTVKSLTKQAFAKLGAINAADAVRIAIVNQLI